MELTIQRENNYRKENDCKSATLTVHELYVCVCVCIYMFMYVCKYIYTYTHKTNDR